MSTRITTITCLFARLMIWTCIAKVLLGTTIYGDQNSDITIQHIADQITSHIDEEAAKNDGYFKIKHEGETLHLNLIRVHMEYLSNLGDGVQFACVDLVEEGGTIYDLDFYLEGTHPDELNVTETTIHKIDGKPLYVWEQREDLTWHRVPVAEADDELHGVVRGQDHFQFTYRFDIPELSELAQLWVPLAQTDEFQKVRIQKMSIPAASELVTDRSGQNTALAMQLGPEQSGETMSIRYEVIRKESGPYKGHEATSLEQYLQPQSLVPNDPMFAERVQEALAGSSATNDLMRARELYKHTLETMRYQRFGDGWGVGDAVYACDARTGNCSDFHSYFIALCRSVGIPARFIVGAAIPSHRNEGGIVGYHCWAEFHAQGEWWPIDVSEADKHELMADYYFGKKPANRIEISRGRDLLFKGMRSNKAFNFLVYPILEHANVHTTIRPELEFERSASQTPKASPGENDSELISSKTVTDSVTTND